MRYKKTLIFSFLIFTLILGLFNVKPVKGALADISYDFNNNVLYDSNSFTYDNSFNLADNITSFTQNYNASYSFENDTIETHPDHFVITEGSGSAVDVIANLDNHNKVVRMNTTTTGAGQLSSISNFFSIQTYGTIEFWYQSNDVDVNHANYIGLRNSGVLAIFYFAISDLWKYDDGATKNVPNVSIPLDNIWQHIRIDFELTGGGYLGMAQYQSIFTVNGISSGFLNIRTNEASLNELYLFNSGFHANYEQRVDAIGYSWLSNYTISDNIFPNVETDTSLRQINAYEFVFNGVDDPYSVGALGHGVNIETWETSGIYCEIAYDYNSAVFYPFLTVYRDRLLRFNIVGATSSYFFKDDLGLNNIFNNITTNFNISSYVNNGGEYVYEIYDTSGLTLDLRIYKSGGIIRLDYHDGGSLNLLYNGINLNTIYDLNICINFEIDIAFILLYENGIVLDYFNIPLQNTLETEIDEIIIGAIGNGGNTIIVDLDYVGLFRNGTTFIELDSTYGYTETKIPSAWNLKHQNLFTFRGLGNLQIYEFRGSLDYFPGSDPANIRVIDNFRIHSNTSIFINVYDIFHSITSYNSLVIYTKQNISFDYIHIEGVSLDEGINKYWLIQSYSGINSNESYFYVNDSNRLQFNHIANDTNLEYIQAEFNIPDISSTDKAIKFKSNIDNNAFGFFRVKFLDISNFIPIPIFDSITRVFISQNKTISSFIILITDDDDDTIVGLTEGYVSEIELLFISGIGVSITTSNLLTIIIPLIIIFIPTFLLSDRVGKNMIVPLMMLMSLICVATEIIPIWLFFVIIFPSSLFLFLKRKERLT